LVIKEIFPRQTHKLIFGLYTKSD